ncbi:MAG TPA: hypothetical protein VJ570_11945 [Holophagaceae bacterium]|nr:hypothetical protein [Holophagaceae bacterium]
MSVYKVPKELPKNAAADSHEGHNHAPGEGHGAAAPGGMTPDPSQAPASTAMDWKDPAGWTREQGSGFRVATFHLPGEAECSVVSLGGAAGGDLANVNRWRGQMGLGDVTSLQGLAKPVKTSLGPATLVEFDGGGAQKGRRMVGVILVDGSTSWFFKLTGPAGAVDKAKPGLIQLLGTLRRG